MEPANIRFPDLYFTDQIHLDSDADLLHDQS